MSGICINEDLSDFFMSNPKSMMTEAFLREYARRDATGQCQRVIYNLNGQRATFDSKVLDPIWKDVEIPDDDALPVVFHGPNGDVTVSDANAINYSADNATNFVKNAKFLHDQGILPFAVWSETTRQCGREAWISVRMNDIHCADNSDSFMHGNLWRKHPEYYRAPYETTWLGKCLDYAQPEVADTMLRYVGELADLFDFDGIELDFTRFFPHLKAGFEVLDAPLITDLVRKIKAVLDCTAKKRGHAVQLGVRLAGQPEQARRQGLDFITWAKECLIDVAVISNFWPAPDGDMPIELWKRLLGDAVELDASLELYAQAFPGVDYTPQTPELLAGLAEQYLYRGADRIYLFNLMYGLTGMCDDAKTALAYTVLGEHSTLDKMARRHPIAACNCEAIGTLAPWPLPCRPEAQNSFFKALRVNVGGLTAGKKASALFGFDGAVEDELELYVNGQRLECRAQAASETLPPNVRAQQRYPLPDGWLHDGDNVVQFRWQSPNAKETKITWFEFDIQNG